MNSIICPTVTETEGNPHVYRTQIERLKPFASRIHIDLMDGDFAPTHSINPVQVWWPEGITADIHIMFRRPLEHTETLIALGPNMVIIHAEAEGDLIGMMRHLQKLGIQAGVSLLKDTTVESAKELIEVADHVLLFSGDLGHFGGHVDMKVLDKVPKVKAINADIEIGWDGGASVENVADLAEGGVDIINVGGAIQRASNPEEAYAKLVAKIQE
jgi:ribulose-phosphate 3-epimerase